MKGLVVCYLVWLGSMGWVFRPKQGALVRSFVVVRKAIKLKERNATSYRYKIRELLRFLEGDKPLKE